MKKNTISTLEASAQFTVNVLIFLRLFAIEKERERPITIETNKLNNDPG
jgi:hypothetical protein